MISAERFAQESGSYWRAVFPKMEHFVRFSNGVASRYAPAAVFQSDPNRHIVISEAAYVRWLWHLRGEADDVDRSFEVASKRLAVVWDQGDFTRDWKTWSERTSTRSFRTWLRCGGGRGSQALWESRGSQAVA